MAKESNFQKQLIRDIGSRFPDSIVMKNDSSYIQGIPDLLILNGKHWAALECKRSENASHQPNQDWYVKKMNEMSYAGFVYPENKEQIFYELEQAFKS